MAMRSKSRALTIDEVRARFEEWRQNRQGKSPIPDELWSAAAELARKDGINRTAAQLHLDGGKLKRLMGAKTTSGKSAPTFVELLTPRAVSVPECTIELERRRGTMRIQLKGASASDLASVSRALWEAAS
jgi:hypothetical protein